ncbi:MAG TPA: hypothetical protein VLJ68_04950 [Chitinophagaceae bacterium]|nr:hypothetical protein [Chitinophagaceae bacterium]
MKNKIVNLCLLVLFLGCFSLTTRGGKNCEHELQIKVIKKDCPATARQNIAQPDPGISPVTFCLLNM